MDIRLLKANEIECRVGSLNKEQTGMSLLLYKDARADMKILDEVFGIDGWEREHQLIDGKLFCTVRIWSEKHNKWISKQDVGTESYSEKEKGQASDSFKRACVNLGIGRELYTAPFIWINFKNGYNKNSKFTVKEIGYNNEREINYLVLVDKDGKVAFKFGKDSNMLSNKNLNNNPLLEKIYELASKKGYSKETTNKSIVKRELDINNFDNKAYEIMFKALSKLEDKVGV